MDRQTDQPIRKESPILTYLYLLIALGGLLYAGLGFVALSEATQNEAWPTAKGMVLTNHVEEFDRTKADGTAIKTYKAVVGYRYEVDGKSYKGSQISLHPSERTIKGVARTEMEPYKIGNHVEVFYDPNDPSRAVLRADDTIGAYQAISVGLSIGLISLFFFMMARMGMKRRAAARA
ncbi:MAG: DUF3592 domain-containing protein [Cohaesibacter sp.]|jgi:hypothetical protein|nr:DUF3592 domain-containing protein [Cohaesibacter sp.]